MPADNILKGLGLRLLAVALLSVMTAMIKLVEMRGAGLAETLFFRQTCALPLVLAWIAAGPGLASIRTRRFGAHVGRAVVGLIAMVANFATIIMLPLAEATVLLFTAPIFATILAVVVLREPIGWYRSAAIATGFVGVLIVAQPGSGHFPLAGALIGLFAAALIAVVGMLLRQIGKTEATGTTVFWFSLLSVIPLGVFYATDLRAHDAVTWALLVGIGLIGGLGQLALTGALRYAPLSSIVAMDYASLVWASLFGWLLFAVLPTPWTWVGAPVIIASGLVIAWREHRLQREGSGAVGTA